MSAKKSTAKSRSRKKQGQTTYSEAAGLIVCELDATALELLKAARWFGMPVERQHERKAAPDQFVRNALGLAVRLREFRRAFELSFGGD